MSYTLFLISAYLKRPFAHCSTAVLQHQLLSHTVALQFCTIDSFPTYMTNNTIDLP